MKSPSRIKRMTSLCFSGNHFAIRHKTKEAYERNKEREKEFREKYPLRAPKKPREQEIQDIMSGHPVKVEEYVRRLK